MTVYIELTERKTDGSRRLVGTYENSPVGRERADKAAFAELSKTDVSSIAAVLVTRRSGQR